MHTSPFAMQGDWETRAKDFECQVTPLVSCHTSIAGKCDRLNAWQPMKRRSGQQASGGDTQRRKTREETLECYKRVRKLADKYIAMEEPPDSTQMEAGAAAGHKKATGAVASLTELGTLYTTKIMAGEKRAAQCLAFEAVDSVAARALAAIVSIGVDTKDPAVVMETFRDIVFSDVKAFTNAGLAAAGVREDESAPTFGSGQMQPGRGMPLAAAGRGMPPRPPVQAGRGTGPGPPVQAGRGMTPIPPV